jgi:hypothetical protein
MGFAVSEPVYCSEMISIYNIGQLLNAKLIVFAFDINSDYKLFTSLTRFCRVLFASPKSILVLSL